MKDLLAMFIAATIVFATAILLNALIYGAIITATMFLVDFICGTSYFSWQYVVIITLSIMALNLIFGGHENDYLHT